MSGDNAIDQYGGCCWFDTYHLPARACWLIRMRTGRNMQKAGHQCLAIVFGITRWQNINTLRPRQNGRRFADDTFKRIFLNENVRISIEISLKFVLKGPINNIPALVQIMAWRRSGDKPLSEPVMVSLLTHIYASLGLNELRLLQSPSLLPIGLLVAYATWSPMSWMMSPVACLAELTHNVAETRWPPFSRRHFQIHFLEWKCINFDVYFTEVSKGQINIISALVQIMAWRRPCDKPLSEPNDDMIFTDICIHRSVSTS